MKEAYTAPAAAVISFKITEELMEPGGDSSIIPGPPDDEE